MSEEILKALMQLFAIVAKQDKLVFDDERAFVKDFLAKQIPSYQMDAYIELFNNKVEESFHSAKKSENTNLTSVKDSVTILKICMKINKTLDQKQKVVVLIRLLEMLKVTGHYSEQRMSIINTTSGVFNVDKHEFELLLKLVDFQNIDEINDPQFLIINDQPTITPSSSKHIFIEKLKSTLIILELESVNLMFLKYFGDHEITLNGLPVHQHLVSIFTIGSTIKLPTGLPLYHSDIYSKFIKDDEFQSISYTAKAISYTFPNGNIGIQSLTISEKESALIGIMGSSGAGKSTLLNILSGITKPNEGSISINGFDLNVDKKELEGVIGFIPQDDMLIESLTVFQNLYFNAKFCFKEKTNSEITEIVNQTLSDLNLFEIKDLKVGTLLNKMISGGQRKRLNIALELIRKPSILFVDEPTSGLSSSDSENVMDLLRELSMKGKLIFVVIHQPSSDIYKLFDKILLMDVGGYLIQYGNPVETISYFKKHSGQAGFEVAQCPNCGSVNPEQLFNIIQSEIVDEYGVYTKKRKKQPHEWHAVFAQEKVTEVVEEVKISPPKTLKIPSKISQWWIYLRRDFSTKISNRQYLLIALLEAPLLALILAYLVKFIPEGKNYVFRYNENIPQYIFMSVIVALFLGLSISAEEIFRDRKILKREKFLHLSKSSYLFSKVAILLVLSALQALLFVGIGNFVLEIDGMYFAYWLTFFSVSFFANILGLNISSAFDSVVTIYILIPLLIIPQMILGGAMFSFDKLNKSVVRIDKVPFVAEIMVSKWAYEGLMVHQFKNNAFEKFFYEIEKAVSSADYYQVYYVPELSKYLNVVKEKYTSGIKDSEYKENIQLLRNERLAQKALVPQISFKFDDKLTAEGIDAVVIEEYNFYLDQLMAYYIQQFSKYNQKEEALVNLMLKSQKSAFYAYRDAYHNEAISDIVCKLFEKHKIINYDNRLIQHVDPIFQEPVVTGKFDFRSHLYAPYKHFFSKYYETFNFNISIIWLMSIVLYLTLRFDLLRKLVEIKIDIKRKTRLK